MTIEFADNSWYFGNALEIPAMGSALPCNFFLLRGVARSILLDCGDPGSASRNIAMLEAVIDPERLDYLFVSHGDLDHYGAASALLKRNPRLRVLCNFEAMAKLNMFAGIPVDRCAVVAPGDEIELGGRTLTAMPALLQDSSTLWLHDSRAAMLYASDGFGALLPRGTADLAEDLPMDDFAQAFMTWQAMHFEQLSLFDREAFADAVDRLSALDIENIASVHGPVIRGRAGAAMELMKQAPDFRLPGSMRLPEELLFADVSRAA